MNNDRSVLKRGVAYPLGDPLTSEECRRWGVRSKMFLGVHDCNVMAVWTGEKRPPKKGEWYLSGAIIDAYRAPNDLGTPHCIARLVKVEKQTVQVITELEEKGG